MEAKEMPPNCFQIFHRIPQATSLLGSDQIPNHISRNFSSVHRFFFKLKSNTKTSLAGMGAEPMQKQPVQESPLFLPERAQLRRRRLSEEQGLVFLRPHPPTHPAEQTAPPAFNIKLCLKDENAASVFLLNAITADLWKQSRSFSPPDVAHFPEEQSSINTFIFLSLSPRAGTFPNSPVFCNSHSSVSLHILNRNLLSSVPDHC
uniref:Uncharacterized protein n=1 Tax=Myotis myotis TaxID=51298 RepID=A0A7J7WHC2_MYOMY|nr:hypothetical protein mMyoMyo1_012011 [Myotis myotis]